MSETDEEGFWNAEKAGITIEELFAETNVDYKKFRMTILVNSSRKDVSYVLQDGDILTVMPLVAGG
ncbi:MAG: MoaD/ThiS family protein [Bacillota bacterium]|nr:MoaD/ThiS family protein [Bacillota bacterium]